MHARGTEGDEMFGSSNGGREFWIRHPLLALMFQFCWSLFVLVAVGRTVYEGRFRWGHGSDAPFVTAAHHPGQFWTLMLLAFFAGASVLWVTIRDVIRRRRRKEPTDRLALYRRGNF